MKKYKNVSVYMTEEDKALLKEKMEKTGLPCAVLIRTLVRGYLPKEKPDDRFYAAMRQMEGIADGIRQLADGMYCTGRVDPQELDKEVIRWHRFQAEIERQFLRPEDDRKRWR